MIYKWNVSAEKKQITLFLGVPWRPRWRCSRRGGRYTRRSRATLAVTRPCRRSTKARHAWSFQFHRTRQLDERRPFEPSTRVPISCNRCGRRVKEAIKFIFSKVHRVLCLCSTRHELRHWQTISINFYSFSNYVLLTVPFAHVFYLIKQAFGVTFIKRFVKAVL